MGEQTALRSRFDAVCPHRGPCGFCGHEDARHRLIDALAERNEAGESVGELARDYGYEHEEMAVLLEASVLYV